MRNSNKKTLYVEQNNTNIYAKFQLRLPYDFWEEDFFKIFVFKKINISAAMATNQNQQFGQNSYRL